MKPPRPTKKSQPKKKESEVRQTPREAVNSEIVEPAPPKAKSSTKIDLFILRHGEAGNRMTVVEDDSERPLTPEGRSEMLKIARSLRAAGLQTERICSSPLKRAHETAEITAEALKIPMVEEWDELKPEGNKASLYRKLAKLEKGSRIMLVGHEPYLTTMIGEIIGTGGVGLVLKKGGLGKVRITSLSPRISGELRWLLTPRMITRMS